MTLRFWTEEAADPDEVMENWEFIMNNVLLDGLERTTVPGFDDFFFTRFYDNSGSGDDKIDSTNSTCCYASPLTGVANRGKAWFCTQFDQFDDSSISAVNWTTATGGSGSSVIESGINITLLVSLSDTQNGNATLTSDGSSGLDMRGQDGEVIFFASWETGGTTGGSEDKDVELYVGTTLIKQFHTGSENDSQIADFRLVFNNSAQTVDLYEDGSKTVSAQDISGEGTWDVAWRVDANSSSGDTASAKWVIYTVGFVKDGDSNTPDFVTSTESASSTVDAIFLRIVTSGGSTTLNGSADSGGNYSTLTNKKLAAITNTGVGVKFKATQTVPSINSSQVNIESITEFGVFYG